MAQQSKLSPLLLLGGGGHCRSVIDVLEEASYPIAGIVHGKDCDFSSIYDYPALGHDENLARLRKEYNSALVTVGQIKSPAVRQKLFARLQELDFMLPSIISPLAHVSRHAYMGQSSIAMHQSLINAGVSIGDNCIINTRALIEHDSHVNNHCHIAVNAILCGGVTIGEGCFIGAGAIVRENVRIGKNCIIGCGVTVLHDIEDFSIIKGSRSGKNVHHC